MTTKPLLQVEHVTMRFGGLTAVNDLSFEARKGDITALIGPNGAGKTTVFNCITGFYKPTEGRLTMRRGDGSHWLLERMPDTLPPIPTSPAGRSMPAGGTTSAGAGSMR